MADGRIMHGVSGRNSVVLAFVCIKSLRWKGQVNGNATLGHNPEKS
jgi:hypothetical protein